MCVCMERIYRETHRERHIERDTERERERERERETHSHRRYGTVGGAQMSTKHVRIVYTS